MRRKIDPRPELETLWNPDIRKMWLLHRALFMESESLKSEMVQSKDWESYGYFFSASTLRVVEEDLVKRAQLLEQHGKEYNQAWNELLELPIDAWRILDLCPDDNLTRDDVDLAVGRAMAATVGPLKTSNRYVLDEWVNKIPAGYPDDLGQDDLYYCPVIGRFGSEEDADRAWDIMKLEYDQRLAGLLQQRIGRAMLVVYYHFGWCQLGS